MSFVSEFSKEKGLLVRSPPMEEKGSYDAHGWWLSCRAKKGKWVLTSIYVLLLRSFEIRKTHEGPNPPANRGNLGPLSRAFSNSGAVPETVVKIGIVIGCWRSLPISERILKVVDFCGSPELGTNLLQPPAARWYINGCGRVVGDCW